MRPRPLSWHIDSRDGLVTVTVLGTVDTGSGPALYRAVTQCLPREPVAIVVELSGARVTGPEAAKTFSMILHQADLWPGTPVLLCAPDAGTAGMITNGCREPVPLFATVADALAVLTGRHAVISEHIPLVQGAARHARNVVTDACLRWELSHLTAAATVVASELVTNAVVHAGTAITLQARLRPRHLYLAVFDGSPVDPVLRPHHPDTPGGRGLHMVELFSTRWGYQRQDDGKVVWASFATSPAR